ncbi:hypothetical protein [Mycobacterium paraterrae]|uniref:PE-PGRS family protein n=1 Tax=Mycobacterium paraterrae TaxID=577492 RepID=A0ABY3VPD7_9MYCO|nr:hypothetical protein [Mycobacterium paraterrae]UMB71306.1 hypothetical protein MKK62_08695 [Mycobacterium paraterrae]
MKVRHVAAIAGIATGAAVAFAPLSDAAPTDLIDFDSINNSEIASLNSLFAFGATLTGVPDTAYTGGGPGELFALTPAGIAEFAPKVTDPSLVTPFEYYMYGVDPIDAGISSGTSAANVFNGAAINFADSFNATLYGLLNPNEVAPDDVFIGSANNVAAALASDNAAIWFYDRGIDDLSGYFQQDLSFLQLGDVASPGAADPVDLSSVFTAEVEGLNSLFGTAADAAGLSDKVVEGTGVLPWDTIPLGDSTDYFNTLIFGLNPENVIEEGSIGSYHVLNGALTEFANAYNVGLFALLNGGDLIDSADIFGTHAEFLEGGVVSAISDFVQLGFNDILGYFDPSALIPSM